MGTRGKDDKPPPQTGSPDGRSGASDRGSGRHRKDGDK